MVGIGFFAPLPLAIMIPFMAAQSAVMGEAFGKHYQYGKRKISSMSNEEFNKLDGGDVFGSIVTDYLKIIPQIQRAMEASSDFQDKVISEIIKIVPRIPGAIAEGLTGEQSSSGTAGAQLAGIPSFLLPITGNLNKLLEAQKQVDLAVAKAQQPTGGLIGPPKPGLTGFAKLGIQPDVRGQKTFSPTKTLPTPEVPPSSAKPRPYGQSAKLETVRLQQAINNKFKELAHAQVASKSAQRGSSGFFSPSNAQAHINKVARLKLEFQVTQKALINHLVKYGQVS